MIKLIGIKRLFLISVLSLVIAAIAALYFMWMEPARTEAESQLSRLNSEINGLRGKITTVKEELATTEFNLPYFESLENSRFFSGQDRFAAARLIQNIRNESGVKTAEFAIEELSDIEESRASEAGYRLIMSTIQINKISSYTDREIYRFLYLMNNRFPGHVRLVNFNIDRENALTPAILNALSQQNNQQTLMAANAQFQWWTMLKEEDVPDLSAGQQD